MKTLRTRLKKTRTPIQPILQFDLKKLKGPDVAFTFQATTGEIYPSLIELMDDDLDIDTMITTYNTAVIEAARPRGYIFFHAQLS